MRRGAVLLLFAMALPLHAGEIQQFGSDVKAMAMAPLHWTKSEWARFAEGAGTVAALVIADKPVDDFVQCHRTSSTDRLSRAITPWGGQRAVDVSVLMIGTGLALHDDNLLGAGRDSLESEIWAGTVVTPLIKRAGGRARPFLGEGPHSFRPEQGHRGEYSSFPSGHATNAFATATAIAEHYDGPVPYIAYAVATAVSYSRVNDHVHWPSDVVAGALIGRAVAKSVVFHNRRMHVAPVAAPRGMGMVLDYRP
jgi:hypothetical protein